MSNRRPSSAGLKVLTFSVAGMLLSCGLCGAGSFAENHHLPLADFMDAAGAWLFVICAILAGIGMIMFLFTDN